jgi:hypothetical protein
VPNPPSALVLEVELLVFVVLAALALALEGFASVLFTAGLSVFKTVGMV